MTGAPYREPGEPTVESPERWPRTRRLWCGYVRELGEVNGVVVIPTMLLAGGVVFGLMGACIRVWDVYGTAAGVTLTVASFLATCVPPILIGAWRSGGKE